MGSSLSYKAVSLTALAMSQDLQIGQSAHDIPACGHRRQDRHEDFPLHELETLYLTSCGSIGRRHRAGFHRSGHKLDDALLQRNIQLRIAGIQKVGS